MQAQLPTTRGRWPDGLAKMMGVMVKMVASVELPSGRVLG